MPSDDPFTMVTELAFDLDADEEAERGFTEVIDDETLSLLRRRNRVGVARAPARPVPNPDLPPDRCVYDLPLVFVVHAHPECAFAWSRLLVDLSPTPGCVVTDMAPRAVEDVPVEVETTVGVDMSFSLLSEVVDVGAKPEVGNRRTVYFPTLLASGVGFRKAYWDFHPKAGDYLHTDKELHLLVEAPAHVPVLAALTVRARVRFRGLPRLVPLLARTGHAERLVRLA